MSDNPATKDKEVQAKPPAKPGDHAPEVKVGPQSEATRRLFAATLPLTPHPALEASAAKPKPESSSWSFSSLTASAKSAVGHWFSSSTEKSLPNVHLVGDKPAAAAPKPTEVAAPASTPAKPAAEHKDIFDRITGAVLDPKGTTKAITDTYHQWTSGKMSSGEKVAALGTAALVVGSVIPGVRKAEGEINALEHGLNFFSRADREVSTARKEGALGLASIQALKKDANILPKPEGFKFAAPEPQQTQFARIAGGQNADILAGLGTAPKTEVPKFVAAPEKAKPFVAAPEAIHTPEVRAAAPASSHLEAPAPRVVEPASSPAPIHHDSTAHAPVEAPKPFVAPAGKPESVIHFAPPKAAETAPARFVSPARTAEPQSVIHAEAPKPIESAPHPAGPKPARTEAAPAIKPAHVEQAPVVERIQAKPEAAPAKAAKPVTSVETARVQPAHVEHAPVVEAPRVQPAHVEHAPVVEAPRVEPVRTERAPVVEAPRVEPVRAEHAPVVEAPRVEPVRSEHAPVVEAPRVEPVRTEHASVVEAPRVEPVRTERAPVAEAPKVAPVHAEHAPATEAPRVEPVRTERAPVVEAPKVAPVHAEHAPATEPPRVEPVRSKTSSDLNSGSPDTIHGAPTRRPEATQLNIKVDETPAVAPLRAQSVHVEHPSSVTSLKNVEPAPPKPVHVERPEFAEPGQNLTSVKPVHSESAHVSESATAKVVEPTSGKPAQFERVTGEESKPVVSSSVHREAPAPSKTVQTSDRTVSGEFAPVQAAPAERRLVGEQTANKPSKSELPADIPAARVVEPGNTHLTEVPTARPASHSGPEALRTEHAVAETQFVARSNALAEHVHKVELPANAAPELQAAKTRLQESSLLVTQSADRAKVLEGMQSDLRILEKSVAPEKLTEIKKGISELQAQTTGVERSAVHVVERESASAPSLTRVREGQPRAAENFEPTPTSSKVVSGTPRLSEPATLQAPHAVSVQEQSLKLLEGGELSNTGRRAASQMTQTAQNWQELNLAQRTEAVSRLEANLKVLKAEANGTQELSTLTKSVERLKLGTNTELAAAKADAELSKVSSRVSSKVSEEAEFKAAHTRLRDNTQSILRDGNKAGTESDISSDLAKIERVAGPEAVAPLRRSIADLEKAAVERDAALAGPRLSSSNANRFEAAAESRATASPTRPELTSANAEVRSQSTRFQEQSLGLMEKDGLSLPTRRALSSVVQDSGNLGHLASAERDVVLRRIEQNLKIAGEDKAAVAEVRSLSRTFESVEGSSIKAQRLENFNRVSSESIPRIGEETAALRKSHLAHPTASAEEVGANLKSIDKEAASFASSADKTASLNSMQASADRLERVLGRESVAPLRENIDRLEQSHRGLARAHKVEETAAHAAASRESLGTEARELSTADKGLSQNARAAAEDVRVLAAGGEKLDAPGLKRLNDGVGAVSRETDAITAARLHGHVHHIETNHQLQQLDRTLTSVAQDSAAIDRQAAMAAARTSNPSVAALHQATEALKVNGVVDLAGVRVAYEKALPALGREDAININRSLSRIESQTAEAYALKSQIAERQEARLAYLERTSHLHAQSEMQRARDIHQLVTSPRDAAVEAGLGRAREHWNTSNVSVFKASSHSATDAPVVGLTSKSSRWREISDVAHDIAARVRESVQGLQRHPVAASLSVGISAFMLESGRAMAQTRTENQRTTSGAPIDFSPRPMSTLANAISNVSNPASHSTPAGEANVARAASTSVPGPMQALTATSEQSAQQPLVKGKVSSDIASLNPTVQALLRTHEGGYDPTNGQRMKIGNSFVWLPGQAAAPVEASVATAVYSKVVKASTISVGQPDAIDKDRPRIYYPPFKSPMTSISAKVRKPQSLLGIETVSLANSTAFLNGKLSPSTTSLNNPLNFTREKADGGSEDRGGSATPSTGGTIDLAAAGVLQSSAVVNSSTTDPNSQSLSQAVANES